MNVVWSPLALEKLGDAADFIALDNPVAAEKWVNEVLDTVGSFYPMLFFSISGDPPSDTGDGKCLVFNTTLYRCTQRLSACFVRNGSDVLNKTG